MLRRIVLALAIVAPSGAAALEPPPSAIALTAEEEEVLAERDPVVRMRSAGEGAETVAVIEVAAPPRAVIDAVLDVVPRATEVGSLDEVEVYAHAPAATPETMGVRWQIGVVGRKVEFHTRYEIDRAAGWCTYALDPDRPNDMATVKGSYQVYRHGPNSRLVYRSVSDAGVSVPMWLKRWLAKGPLEEQLTGIRARAEGT